MIISLLLVGPKALVSDFSMWDGALSSEEVNAMHLTNSARIHHAPADVALTVLKSAQSTLAFSNKGSASDSSMPAVTQTAFSDSNEEAFVPQVIHIDEDPVVPILLQRAQASLDACESYETRLDLYAEAAERGSAEALYKWALLIKQGSEVSNTVCGVASGGEEAKTSTSASSSSVAGMWGGKTASQPAASVSFEHERATQAMLIAADMGHAPALVSLAFTLLNGYGAQPMLHRTGKISTDWSIPAHPAYTMIDVGSGRRVFRNFLFQESIAQYLHNATADCRGATPGAFNSTFDLSARASTISDSVLVPQRNDHKAECADPSALAIGFLQVAALHRVAEAHQALAHRFKNGMGVSADEETAASYLRLPAALTAQEFHRVGAQAIVETDRIDDLTAPEVRLTKLFICLLRTFAILFMKAMFRTIDCERSRRQR